MNVIQLPKDLNNICCSYLTDEECIYVNNEWTKFNKDYVCNIAAHNGWLDLLIWARQNDCEWNSDVCGNAAWNGHLEVLKWAKLNGCVCGGKYHKE